MNDDLSYAVEDTYVRTNGFDSEFGCVPNPGLEMIQASYGTSSPELYQEKRWVVQDTVFSYVRSLNGGMYSGGVGSGFTARNAIGRNSKQIRMAAPVPFAGTKMKSEGYERNIPEEYRPREYWGDL